MGADSWISNDRMADRDWLGCRLAGPALDFLEKQAQRQQLQSQSQQNTAPGLSQRRLIAYYSPRAHSRVSMLVLQAPRTLGMARLIIC